MRPQNQFIASFQVAHQNEELVKKEIFESNYQSLHQQLIKIKKEEKKHQEKLQLTILKQEPVNNLFII